jgi:hypothetical protein
MLTIKDTAETRQLAKAIAKASMPKVSKGAKKL